MIRCLHCGAQTSNGLALCQLCIRLGSGIFEMLPVYFRNLSRQTRPGRPNGTLGVSGGWIIRRGESDGSKVAVALERVVNDLDTWSRALTDDRGASPVEGDTETETVVALCGFLGNHLTSIATLEWAGQFLRDVARHERVLRGLTESVVPGWYAGKCQRVTGRDMEGNTYRCGADTFVVPGLTWVTCNGVIGLDNEGEPIRCGSTTYARDHLEVVLEEARGWLARPKYLAEALVALLDNEPSVPRLHERIKKWEQRGKLTGVCHTKRDHVYDPELDRLVVADVEVGLPRYLLGDVLDLIVNEGQTRLQRTRPRTVA
jgi:hypothetical protein